MSSQPAHLRHHSEATKCRQFVQTQKPAQALGSAPGRFNVGQPLQPAPVRHKQSKGYSKKDDIRYEALPRFKAAVRDSIGSKSFVPCPEGGLGRGIGGLTLI